MTEFESPEFSDDGQIEVRVDESGVSIYGNKTGLAKFIRHCERLVRNTKSEGNAHIHLEDFDLLTRNSKRLVIACFETEAEGTVE
jgi:hypothetical protein